VQKTSTCWLWTGALFDDGYGAFQVIGRARRAHRFAYLHFVGEILDGMLVLHRCDTPRCVRPDHLWVGTSADNMRDMAAKGRGYFQKHPERMPRRDQHGEKNGSAKLSTVDVLTIRSLVGKISQSEIGRRFGITQGTASRVINSKRRALG